MYTLQVRKEDPPSLGVTVQPAIYWHSTLNGPKKGRLGFLQLGKNVMLEHNVLFHAPAATDYTNHHVLPRNHQQSPHLQC